MKTQSEFIENLKDIAQQMGGEFHKTSTLDSRGRTSEKVIIEYNIQHKK